MRTARYFLFLLLLLNVYLLRAQSIDPDVLLSSGDVFTEGDTELHWTLGETAIEYYENGDLSVQQGFLQINLEILSSTLFPLAEEYQIKVFPNPTAGSVYLSKNEQAPVIHINIIDQLGNNIYSYEQSDLLRSYDLSAYPNGVYYFILFNESSVLGTYKLLKTN